MKSIVINAQNKQEIRVALLRDNQLFDMNIETIDKNNRRANIYKGVVTRVEPSLEAAFIDYGQQRHGFLPFKEIHAGCFGRKSGEQFEVAELIKPGQEFIVQLDKEERGNKGASLTTHISLAGAYLVFMPTEHGTSRNTSGISRSLGSEERQNMREVLTQLQLPEGMRIILRTSGVGQSIEELQWNLDMLIKMWRLIEEVCEKKSAPFLVYKESGLIERTIRDYLRNDVDEVLIDDDETYQEASALIKRTLPDFSDRLKKYSNSMPVFQHFDIEKQIEDAFSRIVELPSGGAIVIDSTEALIAVDVNSGKATQGGGIEETALQTNLEAAEELARQMRLRDLGGLMVIDFIDMSNAGNRRQVEEHVAAMLKYDRARVKIGRISRFGLMEMSRQRLGSSLLESSQKTCPRCSGAGLTRSVESISSSVIRALEEAALAKGAAQISLQTPTDMATYLINEKREDILRIEERQCVKIVIIPNENMQVPEYDIESWLIGDKRLGKNQSSYKNKKKIKQSTEAMLDKSAQANRRVEVPALSSADAAIPAPRKNKKGFFLKLFSLFMTEEKGTQEPKKNRRNPRNDRGGSNNYRGRRRNRSGSNNNAKSNSRRPAEKKAI